MYTASCPRRFLKLYKRFENIEYEGTNFSDNVSDLHFKREERTET